MDHCRQEVVVLLVTVVWVDVTSMAKLLIIRWVVRSALLSFNFAGVMLQISFWKQCTPYSSYNSFDRSRSLTNSVVELYRPNITHWWLMTFTSFKIHSSIIPFPFIRRFWWRHRLIWSLIGWSCMQISIHLSMCIRCRSLIA